MRVNRAAKWYRWCGNGRVDKAWALTVTAATKNWAVAWGTRWPRHWP